MRTDLSDFLIALSYFPQRNFVVVADIGGNTAKVEFFDANDLSTPVYTVKNSSGLSAGINKTSTQQTLDVMKDAAKIIQTLQNSGHTVYFEGVGTAPFRKKDGTPSKKGLKLAKFITDETGLQVQILEPEKEAYFVGMGLVSQHPDISCVVFDTGGGSTEFTLIEDGEIKATCSLPLGMRSIPAIDQDPRAFIRAHLRKLPADFIKPDLPLVASGGIFRYIMKSFLSATGENPKDPTELSRFFAYTQSLAFAHGTRATPTLCNITGVKKKRVPQFPIAAVLLSEIRQVLTSEEIILCVSTMRQGIAADIAEEHGLGIAPTPGKPPEAHAA